MEENEAINKPEGGRLVSADDEYFGAITEIQRNLKERRLMFTILNILLPGILLGLGDMLSGADYPAHLSWILRHSIILAAGFLFTIAMIISFIIMRCHFGLVINGTKLGKIHTGSLNISRLSFRSIALNFVFVNSIIAGACALLVCRIVDLRWFGIAFASGTILVLMILFYINHKKASIKCRKLDKFWEPGEVSLKMLEKHKLVSLEATNDDISIIAAMSAAVFIGFYSALSNISGINPTLQLDLPVDIIKNPGISWLTGFICILILFSSLMIARLRLAIGKFSVEIAELHGETDDAYRFKVYEKTFLLYMITIFLAACTLTIFIWTIWDVGPAIIFAGGLIVLSILFYWLNLKKPV